MTLKKQNYKHMKFYILTFFILISSYTGVAAQNDADALLSRVTGKLQKIHDYSVNANIRVDMPFIRMLPVNVKIFFKQKDKFHVESKNIAVVPRQGFNQFSEILTQKSSYTAIIQGEENIGNIKTSIVNVIPLSDTSDMILGRFWIDPLQNVILKSQLTTRLNGTIVTEYTYGSQINYGLPDKMVFTVDTKKFRMPKSMAAEMNKNAVNAKDNKSKDPKKGNIIIVLSGYQINKGISDSVFKKS